MTWSRWIITAAALLGGAGCVTNEAEPAPDGSRSLISVHRERLLKPFQNGQTFFCRSLDVQVSAPFVNSLALPAGGTPARGADFEVIEWKAGDPVRTRAQKTQSAPLAEPRPRKFHVLIGTSHFVVDKIVRVKKLMSAAPTLTVTAAGHVLVLKDAKQVETCQEVHFAEGRMRSR